MSGLFAFLHQTQKEIYLNKSSLHLQLRGPCALCLHVSDCAVLCKSLTLPLIHFYFATEKSRVIIFKVVLSYSFPGFFHTFSPVFVPGFSEECFLFFFFLLTQLTLTYESIKHKEEPNKPVLCLHVTDNLSNN